MERARLLIEQAEALGEPPEDPLLLFSVLYGFGSRTMSHSTAMCARACGAVPGARREARGDRPLMIGHRLMGTSLLCYGRHSAKVERTTIGHCALRSRRASSSGDAIWPRRSGGDLVLSVVALWFLGYPEAALADAEQALKDAREIGQAATLMYALYVTSLTHILLRKLRGSKYARR